jgi:stress-induced morphogen
MAAGLYDPHLNPKASYRRKSVKEHPMPMDSTEIERLIRQALPDADVTIKDLAGDGDHYAAVVVSESFRGKSRVQQHQMVYNALQGNMGGVLHALALQTSAPDQI